MTDFSVQDEEVMDMFETPVYLIAGFLESGKTTFIQEVLSSPDFADGARTLLLQCEEGEVEYDEKEFARQNIDVISVEDEDDLTPAWLERCQRRYRPQRVFVEFNGMWDVKKFCEERLPKRWEVVQIITIVDGSTFDMYLTNMRSILNNLFSETELVIFNRCSEEMDLHRFRRAIKGVNQAALISFEDENGEQIELGSQQPPYDLNADIIRIEDVDWGLWFLDMNENPDRYDGKTVQFTAKVMIPKKFAPDCFIPGRNAMTCCAEDIRFIGYICRTKHIGAISPKQWLEVTAEVHYEYRQEYHGEGPVLYAKHLKSAPEPADELVYFN